MDGRTQEPACRNAAEAVVRVGRSQPAHTVTLDSQPAEPLALAFHLWLPQLQEAEGPSIQLARAGAIP